MPGSTQHTKLILPCPHSTATNVPLNEKKTTARGSWNSSRAVFVTQKKKTTHTHNHWQYLHTANNTCHRVSHCYRGRTHDHAIHIPTAIIPPRKHALLDQVATPAPGGARLRGRRGVRLRRVAAAERAPERQPALKHQLLTRVLPLLVLGEPAFIVLRGRVQEWAW